MGHTTDFTCTGTVCRLRASDRTRRIGSVCRTLLRKGTAVGPRPEARQHHPVVAEHKAARAESLQLRVADAVTAFAGSMPFIYIHAVGFAIWMCFFEADPWPKLTLVVSLEAIFLSTFVMIGQNRQAAFQQAKAD